MQRFGYCVNIFLNRSAQISFRLPLPDVACLPLPAPCFCPRLATGGELYQRLRKVGKRFSKNAFIPSFWSDVANVLWNIRRSY